MTVQQLFQEIDEEELIQYYFAHDECASYILYHNLTEEIDKLKSLIREVLRIFKTRTVTLNPDNIFFVIPYRGMGIENYAFFCEKTEILNKDVPEHYSIDEIEWDKALGGTLSHCTYWKFLNKVEIAYALFVDLTYMGFEEEERKHNIEWQFEEIKSAVNDISDKVIDFKDALNELGIEDFEFDSDPFEDEYYQIEGAYRRDIYNLFMKYEKNWLQESELLETNS